MTEPLFFREIHIENTNSCGYKCVMCPRERQTRRIGYMSLEDFSLVLERVSPFQGFFHLHGFGEPLLDRQLDSKVRLLQEKSPRSRSVIFSTLGVKVKEDHFLELLEAGLNCIVVSMYGFTREDYKQIHGFDGLDLVKRNLQLLSRAMKVFPASFGGIIKIPSRKMGSSLPIAEPLQRSEFVEWAKGLGFDFSEWAYVHNYSDGRGYNEPKPEKMCPVIRGRRRNILNITWDLNVIPCCYDYNATIPFGNLRANTLEEIFASPAYLEFLNAHKTNNLDAYPICKNCEKIDYS